MRWVHFVYISVASRNHTRDECTAAPVGGASSGRGTANGIVSGIPSDISVRGVSVTLPHVCQGVIVVCWSMTPVASINGPIWSSVPSALSCRTYNPSLPGITTVF